jgi:uncharacterized protein (TIGR02117 family)
LEKGGAEIEKESYEMKKLFSIVWKSMAAGLAAVILYFLVAVIFSFIPVNRNFKQPQEGVTIYLLTNGVHTDFVLPVQNQLYDWEKIISRKHITGDNSKAQYVAFGWGDKGFYLNTKTWDDLKFSTAFNALFHLSTSAIHVTWYPPLHESESCRKIRISEEQYRILVEYIIRSFQTDDQGAAKVIVGAHYWDDDSFYEAKGSYSLFYTCNTWVNDGLKKARLPACLWTPFDRFIFQKYKVVSK